MSEHDEITVWLDQLVQGDPSAADEIWTRYWENLVQLARKKLKSSRRREADEEDVALSAFHSFCKGAAAGRFPDIRDRHDLWKLLVTITARKAIAQMRREHAQKRGEGEVRGESVFFTMDNEGGLGEMLGGAPTPSFAATTAEQCELLLGQLDDDLRRVALLKLEGYTDSEIAEQLGCVPSTIWRRLGRIKTIWSAEMEQRGGTGE